ncbi:MAG: hypothetical protein DLM73_15745 [Chthoniobacterales bacterium]|nr:MAG: hypothetical protein DLM73_15745 [Chthoniobacterales bacterium]
MSRFTGISDKSGSTLEAAKDSLSKQQSPSQGRWALFVVFALVAALALCLLPRQSLWIDEIFSLALATGHSLEHPAAAADKTKGDFIEPASPMPAAEWQQYLKHEAPPASPGRAVRAVLLSDTSPPLYYLLLYLWTLIWGTSDFALRSLSVLCSLACFPFVVSVARRTGGPKSVAPACILFPLAPLLFYYSTEGRMYSLLLLTLLATASAALRLQEEGGSLSRSIMWIGSSAAGLLTHYFFFFPWAGIVIFLLLLPGKLSRREILLFLLPIGLIILPWYVAAFECQAHLRSSGAWFNMHRSPEYDLVGAARDQVLQSFSGDGYGLWKSETNWSRVSLLLFGCVFLVAFVRRHRQLFEGPRLLLWLWFIGAALAPTALDFVDGTYLSHHPRYAVGAAPPAYFLASFCLTSVGKVRSALMALIVCSWIPSILNIWRQDARIGEPYPKLIRAMALTGAKNEAVIVDSIPSGVLGFARYANSATEITSWIEPLGTRKIPDSLITFSHGYRRVLLVNIHGFHPSMPEETWLRKHFETANKRGIAGFEIVDFRSKAETF